jgi:hypothetical protein
MIKLSSLAPPHCPITDDDYTPIDVYQEERKELFLKQSYAGKLWTQYLDYSDCSLFSFFPWETAILTRTWLECSNPSENSIVDRFQYQANYILVS